MTVDIFEGLNKMQKIGVETTEGPLLILAGAGSGKTTVMTRRIAHLIKNKNVKPGNILGVTFTNKAANEMKERLVKLVGEKGRLVNIYTFHAFCVRKILRQHIDKIEGYKINFTIYDENDSCKVIEKIIKELELNKKDFPAKMFYKYITNLKTELVDVESFLKRSPTNSLIDWKKALNIIGKIDKFLLNKLIEIYPRYQEELKKANAIDFNDMINYSVKILYENEDIREYYQNTLHYIIVDEYQDTNRAQYWLVKLLAEKHRNIAVVGDDYQGIYKWRGADIRNILEFEKDYPEAKIIKLEQNYRSTKYILNVANQIISNNKNQRHKKLFTNKKEGKKVKYYNAENEIMEAKFIANEILKGIENGRNFSDYAILVRINAYTRTFEEEFIRSKIPYEIVNGLKFFERKEIKDILAYLKFAVNKNDIVAFERIVETPKKGIGKSSLSKLYKYAKENNLNIWKSLNKVEEFSSGKAKKGFKKIKELFEQIDEFINNKSPIPVIVEFICTESGLLDHYRNEDFLKNTDRVKNIEQFLTFTWEFEESKNNKATIEELLEKIVLSNDIDNTNLNQNKVLIMTYHSAKGLEFPIVFLPCFEENVIPYYKSIIEENGIEEERRLCYVGATRAKEELYFTTATMRKVFNMEKRMDPSRFLQEFSYNNMEIVEGYY